MLGVIFDLLSTAVFGDIEELLDGVGDGVAEEVALPINMPCGAPCGLDEGGLVTEEPFLIGI